MNPKTIFLTFCAPLFLGLSPCAFSQTPCTVVGQVGFCTPPIPTEFKPSLEEYIATQTALLNGSGVSLTITGNTGWTTPYYTPDFLGGASRSTYVDGETSYPAWGNGKGSFHGLLVQTREFRCLWDDGVTYDVIQPWQQVVTQCFHKKSAPSLMMTVTPDAKAIIPGSSRVISKKVLTRSVLNLRVATGTVPAVGISAKVQSDRGADTIFQSEKPTDANGQTVAKAETRDQSGASHIVSALQEIGTQSPGQVNWLPAQYENKFLITCYVISSESDFSESHQISNVKGLPANERFRSAFITDVRLQGSGKASSGSIIHYDGDGRYSIQSCARTATGACAQDGVSIAVDKSVVPLRGSVDIDSLGKRIAQDTGGAITGNHIDVYFGTRRAECRAAGRRNMSVDFISY